MADLNDNLNEIKSGAKEVYQDVREEAQEVAQEVKAAVTEQTLNSANTVGGAGYREQNNQSSGAAVASLVLGILSLICAFFGYGAVAGLIFGIIGTSLGAKARKQAQTGLATGGFVCSIIGLIFSGIGLVCAIACAGATASLLSSL